MCRFIQINNKTVYCAQIMHYICRAQYNFLKYKKFLLDDFSQSKTIIDIIKDTLPYFWIVTDFDGNYMGFVFLDNIIGNSKNLYSAELTTCFDKFAWGTFPKYGAKIFLKKCFDELGLQKIKLQIYPDNHRTKLLMKSSGFKHESLLKNETLRYGKPQDIEVYALYRSYYYKDK